MDEVTQQNAALVEEAAAAAESLLDQATELRTIVDKYVVGAVATPQNAADPRHATPPPRPHAAAAPGAERRSGNRPWSRRPGGPRDSVAKPSATPRPGAASRPPPRTVATPAPSAPSASPRASGASGSDDWSEF